MRIMTKWVVFVLLLSGSLLGQIKKNAETGGLESRCTHRDYQELLNVSFGQAAGPSDILLIVQVLPSFQSEYALIFKRSDAGVYVMRARFVKKLWSELAFDEVQKTKQQCLDAAKAAAIDTTTIISGDSAQQLWSDFSQINLSTDSCPRDPDKGCVLYNDGTDYVIQVPNRVSVRLFEIGQDKEIKSENPALLQWVHVLLRASKDEQ
jgi:hypothetical protein